MAKPRKGSVRAILFESLLDADSVKAKNIDEIASVAHSLGRLATSKVAREKWEYEKRKKIEEAVATLKAELQKETGWTARTDGQTPGPGRESQRRHVGEDCVKSNRDILPAGAAERLRPAAPLGLVPWIQKTGIQVDGKPFDLDRVPYMRGIFEDDATEKVAEKGSQIGSRSIP